MQKFSNNPKTFQKTGEIICFQADKLYSECGMWSFTLRMYVASWTETHLTFNLRRHDGATCLWRMLQAGDNDFVIEGPTALCTNEANKHCHI